MISVITALIKGSPSASPTGWLLPAIHCQKRSRRWQVLLFSSFYHHLWFQIRWIRCLDQSCQVHSGQQGHPSLPTDLKRGSSSPWALHKNNSRLSFLLRQGDVSSLMVVRTYIGCPWSEGFTPRQSCCVFVMGNRLVIGYIPMQALWLFAPCVAYADVVFLDCRCWLLLRIVLATNVFKN